MQARMCSILVMFLLVFGLAAPLAAQDDELADEQGPPEDQEQGDQADGDQAPQQAEEYVEPEAWEKPPEEAEKAVAGPAAPPPPPVYGDGRPFMVGALVGWAVNTDRNNGGLGADPYGLALGVSGGYTFPFQLYIGVRYVYFLGNTEDSYGGRPPVQTEASTNYNHFAAEAGYDLWAGDAIIRPSALVGGVLGIWNKDGASTPTEGSTGAFMISPGFSVIFPMDSFFLGGDLRGNIVTGDGVSGVGLHAMAGARFE